VNAWQQLETAGAWATSRFLGAACRLQNVADMKLSTLLFASVLGATVFAAMGTASADRYVRGYGYHDRVVVRPYVRPYIAPRFYGPRVVVEPVAPIYAPGYIAPVVVERPIIRPRYWHGPIVVRHGYRRW
jgi:hypothetical protein